MYNVYSQKTKFLLLFAELVEALISNDQLPNYGSKIISDTEAPDGTIGNTLSSCSTSTSSK